MRLHHVGIAVRDLEQAVERYKLLGLKETERGMAEAFRVAISFLEADEDAVKVELLEPLGEGPAQRFLDERGEGLHHVAYAVQDIERALGQLRDRGVRLVDEEPRPGFGGHRVAFLHPEGFNGVLVELVEEKGHA